MLKNIPLFFLGLFLTGCSAVRVTPFQQLIYERKNEQIDVYSNSTSVKRPFKEIALITVDDQGWGKDESKLLNMAIEKAKDIGADAIIVLSQDKQADGYTPVGNMVVAINRRISRITAIVYTGEEDALKKCPFCGEEIKNEAVKCKHCGEWLNKTNGE